MPAIYLFFNREFALWYKFWSIAVCIFIRIISHNEFSVSRVMENITKSMPYTRTYIYVLGLTVVILSLLTKSFNTPIRLFVSPSSILAFAASLLSMQYSGVRANTGFLIIRYMWLFIWLSNLSILSVPDVGYSRNVLCTLNLISTFYCFSQLVLSRSN